MKVEQEGTSFAPITITIETKEEADLMWAALNSPEADLRTHSHGHLKGDYTRLGYHMWKKYNGVYPTGWVK